MLAWSVKPKDFILSTPEFYCPNCHARRIYELKPASEVDFICVIPLFGTGDFTHVAECQACKNGFDPEVVKPSNQSLFRLVAQTRNELFTGMSPGSLKVRLMSDGLKEEVVDKLIMLALN